MIEKLMVVLPEAYVLGLAIFWLILSILRPSRDYTWLSIALGVIGLGVAFKAGGVGVCPTQVRFYGAYRIDLFSQGFKLLLMIGYVLILNLPKSEKSMLRPAQAEYHFLLATALFGMMLLTSAYDLLVLYLAMETTSYSFYVLAVLRRRVTESTEAGLKYVLIGATSSAVMLFGIGYLYGMTGTTSLPGALARSADLGHSPGFVLGLFLMFAGLLFKLSAFPFHFWAPDVYEGTSNQVAAYLGTVSKVASTALTLRIVSLIPNAAELLTPILWVIACASMTYGNFVAIRQTDMKRMLAYSGIGHIGYILAGVLASINTGEIGYTATIYYAGMYMIMNFAAFLAVHACVDESGGALIRNFNDIHRRSPLLGATLIISMFTLGGIPPMAGFFGKLYLFIAAYKAGFVWLVVIGLFNSFVSLYYYLRICKAGFLDASPTPLKPIESDWRRDGLSVVLILYMLFFGFFSNAVDKYATLARSLF